ncbi:MAG: carboxypeptidase regulatory-like domain-containing protein [Myxococcota bacterium]|nr:carboxypeptidase regulatory-like domain-containing protein [Myxococcota bacterium]
MNRGIELAFFLSLYNVEICTSFIFNNCIAAKERVMKNSKKRVYWGGIFILISMIASSGYLQATEYTPGVVEGRVTDASGAGIEGAKITFWSASQHTVSTDANGYYSSEVQAGDATLTVKTGTGVGIGISIVTVVAGQTLSGVDFVWNPGSIEGVITDENGVGIEGAKITIWGAPQHTVSTDASGYYSSEVQSGDATLTVKKGTGEGIGIVSVTVAANQTLSGIDFVWKPGAIEGVVKDANGVGIEGAKITIWGAPQYTVSTDSNGYYFSEVQSGTATVVIKSPTGVGICTTVVEVVQNATIMVDCGASNTPPIAVWKPTLTEEGALALDGTDSTDEDGQIVSYDWQLFDGQNTYSLQGELVSLGDIQWGCYNGTLVVRDGGGSSGTVSFPVCVPKCSPLDNDNDGYSVEMGDCNDNDSAVNPGAPEICDGADNNCNDQIDEGFDEDQDGFTQCGGDCDDLDASINISALELPGNGIDENCDGSLGDCDPNASWKNHGEYVRCVANEVNDLVDRGLISEDEGDVLVNAAAQSDVGKK